MTNRHIHADLIIAWANDTSLRFEAAYSEEGEWRLVTKNPRWAPELKYRIALKKPSINWEHVHPDYKWLVTDADGKSFLCAEEPTIYPTGEWWTGSLLRNADTHASFEPGTCDWKDSLVKRS